MRTSPLSHDILFYLYRFSQLGSFLIRLKQHIQHTCQNQQGYCQSQNIDRAGEQRSNLVDHEGYRIGKNTLLTNGKPGPLSRVHFPLNRANRCEAGRAQQIVC